MPQPLTQNIIDKIFEVWHSHPTVGFIKPTVIELCQVNSKMLAKLQEALNAKNNDVKQQAAEVLGEVGSSEAVLALIRVCATKDVRVRNKAVQALSKISQTFNGKEALIQALSDESNDVKRLTAWVLSQIGDAEAVTSLIQLLLKDDQDSQVKQQVALALGRIGTPEAVQPLISMLLKDDENNQVKQGVAWALGRIRSSQAIQPLSNVLFTSKDSQLRERIVSALGQIGESGSVKTLIQCIHDSDPVIRKRAVIALGEIGDSRVVMGLIQAMHENLNIENEVVWALLQIGTPEALEAIPPNRVVEIGGYYARTVCDYDYILDLNFSANDVLEKDEQKYTKDVEVLIQELLYEDNSKVRQKAAEALGQSGKPEEAVPPLTQALLQDWDSIVREKIAEVLGQMHSPEAVIALTQALLMDQNEKVRKQAAKSLGQGQPYTNNFILPLIHALFKEENINVRYQIAEALGQIGDHKALIPLIYILKFEKHGTITKALEQIGVSTDKAAQDEIQKQKLQHPYNDNNRNHKEPDPDKVSKLRQELLGKEISIEREKEIVNKLVQIGSLSTVKLLITAFIRNNNKPSKENMQIANLAEEGLYKFSCPPNSSVSSVIALNNDKNSEIRRQALSSLGQMRSPEAVIILIQTLKDIDWEVRQKVVKALGEIDTDNIQQLLEIVEALRQAQNDKQIDVSQEAKNSLEKIITPKALENFILALQSKNKSPYTKEQIARLLEQIGTIETLRKLLQLPKNNFDDDYIFSLSRILSLRFIKEFGPIYPNGSPGFLGISAAYPQDRIGFSRVLVGMKEYLALLFHR